MNTILVANSGSSSVKFQLFAIGERHDLKRRLKGQIDGIGTSPRLRATGADGAVLADRPYGVEQVPDVSAALHAAGAWLRDEEKVSPIAIGHRVVHGGPDFDRPVLANEAIIARLERLNPLVPLHQPFNLAPIRALAARSPTLPQVICFDTAFHRHHGPLADHYAIPQNLYEEGIRRYGFHGISYEYIARKLHEVAPEVAHGKVIVAHLGNGASMCALHNGKSVDCTMELTALNGLPMGTRPGQIDPGVILYLLAVKGMDVPSVQHFLYHDCGLKALSGISNDMRELEKSPDPRAAFAIDYFVHRIALYAGMLGSALGGIDAFVFTAGIGENSRLVRARVTERLSWLGAVLDPSANEANAAVISARESRFPFMVVPTDEELMIARHTLALILEAREPAAPAIA